MPNSSFNTFATGARQLVVQLASEIISCFSWSYISSLTPGTIVTSGSFAGAVIITFLQPASRCFDTSFRSLNFPDASTTTSTPKSPHGNFPGSVSANIFISFPFTTIAFVSFSALISPSCTPCTESYFNRCAAQEGSAAWLFIATKFMSGLLRSAALNTIRPILPQPFIATFIM